MQVLAQEHAQALIDQLEPAPELTQDQKAAVSA